jgi:hypothetical protein
MQAITMRRLKAQEEYGFLFVTTLLQWSGGKNSQKTLPRRWYQSIHPMAG